MTDLAYKVKPTSIKRLRALAESFWAGISPTCEQYPIVQMVDVALARHFGDRYTFAVIEKDLMGDSHGLTEPDQLVMLIRSDVYEGANFGVGRDRFTLAHELGHLVLHGGGRYLQRADPAAGVTKHKKYEDSEWQANTFAAELLMPLRVVRNCVDPADLSRRAGVSMLAAEIRFKALKGEGLI